MRKQIVFPGIKNAISWLKSMVGKLKGNIGLEQDTDNATQAISSGTYVIWKGDLYKANTAIASGASLSSGSGGNLTEISGGIGNELNDKIVPKRKTYTVTFSANQWVAPYEDLAEISVATLIADGIDPNKIVSVVRCQNAPMNWAQNENGKVCLYANATGNKNVDVIYFS